MEKQYTKANIRTVQRVISDLKQKLIHCRNAPATRDIEGQLERLHRLVIVDLENYNDLKKVLKKIVD